jgi:hypothetical protein
MFGGGAKKEKKDEDEDRGDNSGSAKAQKAAAAEENPEVSNITAQISGVNADILALRMKSQSRKMSTSSQSSVSPRKLRSRPTKSLRSKFSRCAQSFSNSTRRPMNGRSVGLVMLDS